MTGFVMACPSWSIMPVGHSLVVSVSHGIACHDIVVSVSHSTVCHGMVCHGMMACLPGQTRHDMVCSLCV